VCSSLSNLRSLRSFSVTFRNLSTNAGDQILHSVLSHTQIQNISLQNHIPGPHGVASLISYFRNCSITVQGLGINLNNLDENDKTALERAMEERLGSFALDDVEPEAAPPGRRVRRRLIAEEVRRSKINHYLRLNQCMQLWEDKKAAQSIRIRIMAKFTGPRHRTKLFTLLRLPAP